ncbi:hypothetical protein Bca4012_009856 [Brassica carinata]|uniref:Uncharacterized protein n=1 Tax=Brassica carinata TaxID=52824 RepID=A0A8X7S190_BRACI|nr:hypothetical protein Bca52824_035081 [Brassica carinata]
MSTTARLESEHNDVGRERRRRWYGDPRLMRRFAVEKRKLGAETFLVASFSVDGGDEQIRRSRSTVWFDLAVDDSHNGARQR